ncbi:MAG: hypothetical protein QOE28_139 [Solirubrobacteraceae bacterium]|nr:hypothetical protein [Solirubrobacteraceae bacterium]
MLAAKERPLTTDSAEQEFDFIFTYERDVIVACAQALMVRIASLASATEDHGTHPPGFHVRS